MLGLLQITAVVPHIGRVDTRERGLAFRPLPEPLGKCLQVGQVIGHRDRGQVGCKQIAFELNQPFLVVDLSEGSGHIHLSVTFNSCQTCSVPVIYIIPLFA